MWKNLKSLNLFLILLVLMIGVIGTVSATDIDAGTSNVKIADVNNVTNGVDTENVPNAIEVKIVTDGLSSKSYHGVYLPDGTIVEPSENGAVAFNGKVYLDDNGTEVDNVYVSTDTLTEKDSHTGIYDGNIEISGAIDTLVDGGTYYVGIAVKDTAVAYYPIGDGSDVLVSKANATILYAPFTYTYVKLYTIELVEDFIKVKYGENFRIEGNVTANTATSVPDGTLTFIFKDEDSGDEYIIDGCQLSYFKTFATSTNRARPLGEPNFVIIPPAVYNLTVNLIYGWDEVVAFTYGVLIIESNDINVDIELNTTAPYDDPSSFVISLNDTVDPTIKVTAISQATGKSYIIDDVTKVDDKVYEGIMISNNKPLPVGNYLVTIEATEESYKFNTVTFNYTVVPVETYIVSDPSPLYIPESADTAIITVKVVSASSDDENEITVPFSISKSVVVLRDATGNAIKQLTTSPVVGTSNFKITVNKEDIEEGYYVDITFTDNDGNYLSSNDKVPVFVRLDSAMALNITSPLQINYGEDNITVNVTIVDPIVNTKVLPANGEVAIIVDGNLLDYIDIINGTGEFNLANLQLPANKDGYNIKLDFIDEEDIYCPASDEFTLFIYPVQTYILNVNTTSVTYTLASEEVLMFNVTFASNSSVIAPDTGEITYTITGELDDDGNPIYYTVEAIDGFAIVPVSELEGLYVDILEPTKEYNFAILGNNTSNTVKVEITCKELTGEIIAENITTYNNTPITVEGTVTNTTGGKVGVGIFTAEDYEKDDSTPVAVVTTNVAEDGSFVASFGTLADGEYVAAIIYDGDDADFPADVEDAIISISVNGTSPGPEPVTNTTYATVLTIEPFNETEGAGKSLVGKLALEDGTPVIGMHILLNLTRVSDGASKVYTTTTDYNGEFQFPINLGAGEYTAYATFEGVTIPSTNVTYNASESPVTPFSVTKNGTQPTNETSVIITTSPYVGTYGTVGNFTAKFTNNAGQPLVGYPVGTIEVTLTRVSSGASKTYSYFVTDYNGEITMPIELAPGQYTADIKFKGSTVPAAYDPAEVSTTLTVNKA